MVLIRKGFYKEMQLGEDSNPSMKEYINQKIENKELICQYLKNGYVMAACSDLVTDVIFPENGVIGSPDELTDGYWLWPGDLVYYVEKYNLKLDDDFIDYMRAHSWRIPKDIVIDYDNLEVK